MSSSTPTLTIPVIDISPYLSSTPPSPTQTSEIVSTLRSACISPGFFQITGHSVPADLQARLFSALESFFSLPQTTKSALSQRHSPCGRGYEKAGDQKLESLDPDHATADMKEGFMIGQELPRGTRFLQGPNQWPDEDVCPGFRATFLEYFAAVRELSRTMFRLIALTLDLDERYFDGFTAGADATAVCRGHRYPPTSTTSTTADTDPRSSSSSSPDAKRTRGIGAHTDFGALTLLLQDEIGGLEVLHQPTMTWHPVRPVRGAYVVNIGDIMERWTNNRYRSTMHRVISPESDRPRYSVAFFNEGLLDQVVRCIPTCLQDGETPLYEPIRVEDHLKQRYLGTYHRDKGAGPKAVQSQGA